MIVRDEAEVIERCLASCRPHIDYWVICDTGSSDDTPEIVRRVLDGVPGELHHHEWRDFGHNRSQLMQLAHGKAEMLGNELRGVMSPEVGDADVRGGSRILSGIGKRRT